MRCRVGGEGGKRERERREDRLSLFLFSPVHFFLSFYLPPCIRLAAGGIKKNQYPSPIAQTRPRSDLSRDIRSFVPSFLELLGSSSSAVECNSTTSHQEQRGYKPTDAADALFEFNFVPNYAMQALVLFTALCCTPSVMTPFFVLTNKF